MAHCSVASDGTLFGFVEVDLRSHADGCNPSKPVGYIEGYIAEHYRQQGVGRKLPGEAEAWARSHTLTIGRHPFQAMQETKILQ
jgi:GNAT superfamily N-acetyltransferase